MKTKLTKDEVAPKAIEYFSARNYNIASQTENSIVFQDGKKINWALFLFLFICVLGLGALVYWIVVKEHQVVLQFKSVDDYLIVTATGNSNKSQSTASEFLSLPYLHPV